MLMFEAEIQGWFSILMFMAELLDYGSNLNF
jgi:hypothetical protein